MVDIIKTLALVRARLDADRSLPAALDGTSVEVTEWPEMQRQALELVSDALDAGDQQIIATYREVYEEAQKALTGERQALPVVVSRAEDALSVERRVDIPTVGSLPGVENDDLNQTGAIDLGVLAALPLPFHADPTNSELSTASAPSHTGNADLGDTAFLDVSELEALTKSPLTETTMMEALVLGAEPVPFAGAAMPPPRASWEIHSELGETAELDALPGHELDGDG